MKVAIHPSGPFKMYSSPFYVRRGILHKCVRTLACASLPIQGFIAALRVRFSDRKLKLD